MRPPAVATSRSCGCAPRTSTRRCRRVRSRASRGRSMRCKRSHRSRLSRRPTSGRWLWAGCRSRRPRRWPDEMTGRLVHGARDRPAPSQFGRHGQRRVRGSGLDRRRHLVEVGHLAGGELHRLRVLRTDRAGHGTLLRIAVLRGAERQRRSRGEPTVTAPAGEARWPSAPSPRPARPSRSSTCRNSQEIASRALVVGSAGLCDCARSKCSWPREMPGVVVLDAAARWHRGRLGARVARSRFTRLHYPPDLGRTGLQGDRTGWLSRQRHRY